MAAAILGAMGIAAAPQAYGQSTTASAVDQAATGTEESGRQRWATFGLRLRYFPVGSLSVMGDKQQRATLEGGTYDWLSTTTSRSPFLGAGPSMDLQLSKRVALTGEILFQRIKYDAVTGVYQPSDGSMLIEKKEVNKASLWDFPVMVHVGGFREGGLWSKVFVAAGATFRTLAHTATTTKVSYGDGSSISDEFNAQPSRRNLVGAVVGVGFRFIDDYENKVTPEIRYTRWAGQTYSFAATQSPKNQIEISFGFTF